MNPRDTAKRTVSMKEGTEWRRGVDHSPMDWVNTKTGFRVGCPPVDFCVLFFPGERPPSGRKVLCEDGDVMRFDTVEAAMAFADALAQTGAR